MKAVILNLLFFTFAIEALKQSEEIKRVTSFPSMKGQSQVDLTTYDPSLVKVVDPLPISTLVEVLKISSDETFKKFKKAHTKAVKGSKVLLGKSYPDQAQDYYNRLLQDWMPMNEAESAAAKYLLSLDSCSIQITKEIHLNLTACQHHGGKILSDIINRLLPIHYLMTMGTLEPNESALVNVNLIHPPELKTQMTNIVKLFGDDETLMVLESVSPSLVKAWESICKNVKNNTY